MDRVNVLQLVCLLAPDTLETSSHLALSKLARAFTNKVTI